MSNNFVSFISDELLIQFTSSVIAKNQKKTNQVGKALYTNIIDPFSAAFDSGLQGISMEGWIEQEKVRQAQKTLSNAIGDFHQNVLGAAEGWHNAGKGGGYDVGNNEKYIIAELKNKHNTMNARSSASVYTHLSNQLQFSYSGYVAYLVEIIPKSKTPYNKPWSPQHTLHTLRDDIRKIDGHSFYELVTGKSDALHELYTALPNVLESIIGKQALDLRVDEKFEELFMKAFSWSEPAPIKYL